MIDNSLKQELLELASILGVKSEINSYLKNDTKTKKNRPKKWKEKWDYIYDEPSPGKYRIPAEGGLVSRHHPVSQGGFATKTHKKGHFGWDIGNSVGTPVYSIGKGIVQKITNESNNPKGGNAVMILHENGKVKSYYAHLDQINVSPNDTVDENTKIGTIGTSGMIYNGKKRHTLPHLHFQVKVNGTDIDPAKIKGAPIGSLSNS